MPHARARIRIENKQIPSLPHLHPSTPQFPTRMTSKYNLKTYLRPEATTFTGRDNTIYLYLLNPHPRRLHLYQQPCPPITPRRKTPSSPSSSKRAHSHIQARRTSSSPAYKNPTPKSLPLRKKNPQNPQQQQLPKMKSTGTTTHP